ncbi:MAG: CesT family type III secretion system chaperone [Bacteroidota bacterium]
MRLSILLLLFVGLTTSSISAQSAMNNQKMATIFKQEADLVDGEEGSWNLLYLERVLLVLTDEANNRMRIFTPIIEDKELDNALLRKMLSANFHSALDAKYSLYNGFVISTFTHPLAELTEAQLKDAMRQVVNLADTFGTTFSSTELIFGHEEEPASESDKKINQSPSTGKRS